MNQGNTPAGAKSQTSSSSSTTTSPDQFVQQTQTCLNQIKTIRDYYANSGQQAPSGSNIPNFNTLTSELNNLLSWCRSNDQVINQIFQGQGSDQQVSSQVGSTGGNSGGSFTAGSQQS